MTKPDIDDLAAKVAALERRVDGLDSARLLATDVRDPAASEQESESPTTDAEMFWALHGLRSRIGEANGVLFTGAVALPGKARYEWQQGADTDALLDADWDTAAEPLGALGHPVRLALLRGVLTGLQTTSELAALDGLGTTGQLYHHLHQLQAAGWLRTTGRGRYEVPAARVISLLVILTAARP